MVRSLLWVETTLAGLSAVLLVATVIRPEWIELVFGVEPDGGDGSLEWFLAPGLLLVTITCSVLARATWRRTHTAA
jgi:hypothetical protein